VTVNLTWAGPDNAFGTGDDITLHTSTDANGQYTFSGLPSGNYRMSVNTGTLPGGSASWTAVYDRDGTPNSTTDLLLSAGGNRTISTSATRARVRRGIRFFTTGTGMVYRMREKWVFQV
jgi:hypothetical protein